MKKNFKKLIALAMAGAMTVGSLSACGGSSSNDATTGTTAKATEKTTSADAATTAADAVAGIDGWQPFADKVTLKVPVYDRGVEGVPNVSDNYWTKWIQENFGDKYNIDVEFVGITRSAVLESYALLAADKDLPTILMEYDYPKLAQWAADGYLAEYDLEEFAQIAPTYYQRMVDLKQLTYTEMDGKTYFALAERPYFNTNYTFITWVRMDWLNQVGYDHIPATRAEYLDAMQKIMDAGICKHPGGGTIVTGVGSDQNYAYRTYPTDAEEWAMYGDYSIPSLGWEPNKQLLKFANEEYNLGITNPEYYITDAETEKAQFINGEKYQYSGYISADMDWLNAFYAQNPDADLAVAVQSLEADTEADTVPAFRSNNPFGMMIGFSSMASEDEIKAAWMYMEWMTQEENLFTMQWGIEGENYTLDAEGKPVAVADYSGDCKQGFNNSKDYWCVTIEARSAGTIEETIAANAPQGLPEDFTQDIIDNYYNQVAAWEKGWVPVDCMFATEISAVNEYQGDLVSKYVEFRDALTMCKPEEFDALYEKYAQEYLDAGYQEVIDERLAAYNAGLTSKQ